jgi:hypothetical protein
MSFSWPDEPNGGTATLEAPAPQPVVQTGSHQLRIGKVTSMVILTRRSSRVYEGTLAELERIYRRLLIHNLLLGWWGLPFGLIWTPIWLTRNRAARKALRASAAA